MGEPADRSTQDYRLTLFDVVRFRPTPWDPEVEPDEPLTLDYVNDRLSRDGLKLIRVEHLGWVENAQRQAYVLVRLDGREINPPRIYGMLPEVAQTFFHID